MAIRTLTVAPPAPVRAGSTPEQWNGAAVTFVQWWEGFPDELNGWAQDVQVTVSGQDYNATSTTSTVIAGSGTKSFTIEAGKLITSTQFLLIASSASPDNYMVVQVDAYDDTTGDLDVTIKTSAGSGTFNDWIVSLVPPAASFSYLLTSGGSLTGLLTLAACTADAASLNMPAGTAPTAPVDGDWWYAGGVYKHRVSTYNFTVATRERAETLSAKTLAAPVLTRPTSSAALQETPYTITDGASVDIDPANGGIQTWTLGANRTPTATNMASGDSVLLRIADGTAYSVTWTTIGVVWVGGTAPTLATSGYSMIELWKIGSTVYGAYVGDVAS